jgi:hypothetical protein
MANMSPILKTYVEFHIGNPEGDVFGGDLDSHPWMVREEEWPAKTDSFEDIKVPRGCFRYRAFSRWEMRWRNSVLKGERNYHPEIYYVGDKIDEGESIKDCFGVVRHVTASSVDDIVFVPLGKSLN